MQFLKPHTVYNYSFTSRVLAEMVSHRIRHVSFALFLSLEKWSLECPQMSEILKEARQGQTNSSERLKEGKAWICLIGWRRTESRSRTIDPDWPGLVRHWDGFDSDFVNLLVQVFFIWIRAQWFMSWLHRRPSYKADWLVRSFLWGSDEV